MRMVRFGIFAFFLACMPVSVHALACPREDVSIYNGGVILEQRGAVLEDSTLLLTRGLTREITAANILAVDSRTPEYIFAQLRRDVADTLQQSGMIVLALKDGRWSITTFRQPSEWFGAMRCWNATYEIAMK